MRDDAFAALYEAHRGAIVRYLRRRLGDDAAEDAAAEVFARAFRRLPTYREEVGTPLPWLYGIAGHVVRERWRAERRRLRLMERVAATTPMAGDRSTGAGAAGLDDLDPALLASLRRLAPADRETLLLVAWGELSYDETATALGIPVGTVRSRLARVRKQFAPLSAPQPDLGPRLSPGDAHA